jgi:hypothetical protein
VLIAIQKVNSSVDGLTSTPGCDGATVEITFRAVGFDECSSHLFCGSRVQEPTFVVIVNADVGIGGDPPRSQHGLGFQIAPPPGCGGSRRRSDADPVTVATRTAKNTAVCFNAKAQSEPLMEPPMRRPTAALTAK